MIPLLIVIACGLGIIVSGIITIRETRKATRLWKTAEENWKEAAQLWEQTAANWKRAAEAAQNTTYWRNR